MPIHRHGAYRGAERALGIPLFERNRSSKRVDLTGEGRGVLAYAERLLALANEVRDAVSPGTRRTTWPILKPSAGTWKHSSRRIHTGQLSQVKNGMGASR